MRETHVVATTKGRKCQLCHRRILQPRRIHWDALVAKRAVSGSAPDERLGIEIRALVWKIQSGQSIEVVSSLHVTQRERTREVGHGHCIERWFHIV